LPPLPKDRARLLEVKWIVLQNSFRCTGPADTWLTSELAWMRFDQIANEYLTIWEAIAGRIEVFQQWLDSIKQIVSSEIIGFWQTSKVDGGCGRRSHLYTESRSAIEAGLSQAADTWAYRAGLLEISRLDPDRQASILDTQQSNKPIAGFTRNPENHKARAPETGDNQQQERDAGKKFPTEIGRTLDRLRRECNWTFEKLAAETGISKTLILGHINEGKGIHFRNWKAYAKAFSNKLDRRVTVTAIKKGRVEKQDPKQDQKTGPGNRPKTGQNRAK
jgi:hypothetical protein